MVITSASEKTNRRYANSHLQYGLTYAVITFVVLLLLNIYCTQTTQQIFSKSKESTMLDRCRTASLALSELDVLNSEQIGIVLAKNESLLTSRVIVTDEAGYLIYDSDENLSVPGQLVLLPEIVQSLRGYDVFTWNHRDGAMQSRSAAPILSYGTLTGCVYLMDYDVSQGRLMESLQRNIYTVTIILEVLVIIYSLLTAVVFSGRIRKILASMRIIRSGEYSHKVKLSGRDELNLLADEFNELTDRLQVSENKRRQFVSDASHELKTPLASIKLLTDSILQNEMDPVTVREFVGDIGNEADRLNRMSQKLLSLSRIDSQNDGDCEIILLGPTIHRASRMLSELARSSNISICEDIQQDSPILMLEDDLYQIIFNLMENGIKYNTPGGKLTISLNRQNDNAILSISDTGVGIPEDSMPHIFERFYRVDKARSRKSGGSGLGLAIVKNLVERNGGQIYAQSQPGSGSIFTVTFPIFDTEENDS